MNRIFKLILFRVRLIFINIGGKIFYGGEGYFIVFLRIVLRLE